MVSYGRELVGYRKNETEDTLHHVSFVSCFWLAILYFRISHSSYTSKFGIFILVYVQSPQGFCCLLLILLNFAAFGHNCQSRGPLFKAVDVPLFPIEPFIPLRKVKWPRGTPDNLAFKE